MKKINEIYDCNYDTVITGITINSKEAKPGDLFVCTQGVTTDRHDFIPEAIQNGASCLIVKKDGNYGVPYIKVDNPNEELSRVAIKFYDDPASKLKLIGVTGTDGKTTVASIIRDMLGHDTCGYIGTNGVKGYKYTDTAPNTTPECHYLYKYLSNFVDEGLKYASMETSSEAFYRGRLDSFKFDIGILTNITRDHLNIHKTLDNYIDSKKQLFRQIKEDGYAILNKDSKYFDEFSKLHEKQLTYGKDKAADLVIVDYKEYSDKTEIKYSYHNELFNVTSPLLADFNVYNLSCAILTLFAFGFSIDDIIKRVQNIKVPLGRCEFLDFGQDYKVVLDYAHTPNALDNILTYLNKIKQNRIITVTGSAGGREHEKRNDMGKVVLNKSDLVIFTMDDPRGEDPKVIIDEMIEGNTGNYEIIIDREEAIKRAFELATPGDIILIAGKGRDNYMAVGDKYLPYSDYETIKKLLEVK